MPSRRIVFRRLLIAVLSLSAIIAAFALAQTAAKKAYRTSPVGYSDTPFLPDGKWRVHDISRPQPRIVDPGTSSPQENPGRPPADAVVLFNGEGLSAWASTVKGQQVDARWKVENGYMEIVPGTGTVFTKEKFGNCQLHIEWATPTTFYGDGQWRANSGVILMGRYEIQVLDSHNNPTYPDGMAGSIYGQFPPLVNVARKPGEWQSYDIVFEAPRFEGDKLAKPAYITVFHNGVLVHHRQEIIGRMAHRRVGTYAPHGPEEPLALQDHDVPVRFRNIWIRRLKGYDEP